MWSGTLATSHQASNHHHALLYTPQKWFLFFLHPISFSKVASHAHIFFSLLYSFFSFFFFFFLLFFDIFRISFFPILESHLFIFHIHILRFIPLPLRSLHQHVLFSVSYSSPAPDHSKPHLTPCYSRSILFLIFFSLYFFVFLFL